MKRASSSVESILLVVCAAWISVGCSADRYKWRAIEQTYGSVPCASLEPKDILDAEDVKSLAEAPVDAWIVICNQRAYLCTYREESVGWYWAAGIYAVPDKERKCAELQEVPPEVSARMKQSTGVRPAPSNTPLP